MKIDPTVKTIAPTLVGEERNRALKQAPAQSGGEPGSSVQLSSLSSQLREIEANLDAGKAVDGKRVAEIKRSIADGTFEIDSGKVADRLIENTRDFLRANKQ